MVLSKELKDAVSKLPSAKKDKLIFRLLKKDVILANRLLFELVNDRTVEEERKDIEKSWNMPYLSQHNFIIHQKNY